MARTRQLNIRLSPAEMACLQAVRGPRKSQADAVAELVLAECERRCHDHGSAGHEEMAAYYANALWEYDHETGRAWSGRPPTPPPQIQVWNRWASVQEVELADAVTAVWRALNSQRSVPGVMIAALVHQCELLLRDEDAPTLLWHRCAQALTAYRSQQPSSAAASGDAP